ncbi:MAG TPA: hypothetical protein VII02_04175, partial [Gemmatimonadaceae bacterium]
MLFRSTNGYHVPFLLLASVTLLAVSPGTSHAQGKAAAAPAPVSPDLQAARTALAKYSDPLAAVKDGYFSTLACIDFPD